VGEKVRGTSLKQNNNQYLPPPSKKRNKGRKTAEKKLEGQNGGVVRFERAPPEKDTKVVGLFEHLPTTPPKQSWHRTHGQGFITPRSICLSEYLIFRLFSAFCSVC